MHACCMYHDPISDIGSHSAIGSEFDCRSRGREFDPGPVVYFGGD